MIKLIALKPIADTQEDFDYALEGDSFEVSTKERAESLVDQGYAKYQNTDKGTKPVVSDSTK